MDRQLLTGGATAGRFCHCGARPEPRRYPGRDKVATPNDLYGRTDERSASTYGPGSALRAGNHLDGKRANTLSPTIADFSAHEALGQGATATGVKG